MADAARAAGGPHPFEYKMRHFVEVCHNLRYNEAPPEHGVMVQKMLDAVRGRGEGAGGAID